MNRQPNEKSVLSQGCRKPRGRRGGTIVPGTPASLSSDGQLMKCDAGFMKSIVTADGLQRVFEEELVKGPREGSKEAFSLLMGLETMFQKIEEIVTYLEFENAETMLEQINSATQGDDCINMHDRLYNKEREVLGYRGSVTRLIDILLSGPSGSTCREVGVQTDSSPACVYQEEKATAGKRPKKAGKLIEDIADIKIDDIVDIKIDENSFKGIYEESMGNLTKGEKQVDRLSKRIDLMMAGPDRTELRSQVRELKTTLEKARNMMMRISMFCVRVVDTLLLEQKERDKLMDMVKKQTSILTKSEEANNYVLRGAKDQCVQTELLSDTQSCGTQTNLPAVTSASKETQISILSTSVGTQVDHHQSEDASTQVDHQVGVTAGTQTSFCLNNTSTDETIKIAIEGYTRQLSEDVLCLKKEVAGLISERKKYDVPMQSLSEVSKLPKDKLPKDKIGLNGEVKSWVLQMEPADKALINKERREVKKTELEDEGSPWMVNSLPIHVNSNSRKFNKEGACRDREGGSALIGSSPSYPVSAMWKEGTLGLRESTLPVLRAAIPKSGPGDKERLEKELSLEEELSSKLFEEDDKCETPQIGIKRRKKIVKREIKNLVLLQEKAQRRETRRMRGMEGVLKDVSFPSSPPPELDIQGFPTLPTGAVLPIGPSLGSTGIKQVEGNLDDPTLSLGEAAVSRQPPDRRGIKDGLRKPECGMSRTSTTGGAEIISVSVLPGCSFTHMDVFRRLKKIVDPADCGIYPGQLDLRMNKTGDTMMLGITGVNKKTNADLFKDRLVKAVVKDGLKVRIGRFRPKSRQMFKKNVVIRGLDRTITEEEIREAISVEGGCSPGEVDVGGALPSYEGKRSVRVECPRSAVKRIKEGGGSFNVGWSRVTLKAMDRRYLICYRCLEVGHTKLRCTNPISRDRKCLRCGNVSHKIAECNAEKPCCPLCVDIKGYNADHIWGRPDCSVRKGRILNYTGFKEDAIRGRN